MQTVSKTYVDTAIAAAELGHPLDASTPYVMKTGDTMTGPLILPGDPVTPLQAADKNYVDAQSGGDPGGARAEGFDHTRRPPSRWRSPRARSCRSTTSTASCSPAST